MVGGYFASSANRFLVGIVHQVHKIGNTPEPLFSPGWSGRHRRPKKVLESVLGRPGLSRTSQSVQRRTAPAPTLQSWLGNGRVPARPPTAEDPGRALGHHPTHPPAHPGRQTGAYPPPGKCSSLDRTVPLLEPERRAGPKAYRTPSAIYQTAPQLQLTQGSGPLLFADSLASTYFFRASTTAGSAAREAVGSVVADLACRGGRDPGPVRHVEPPRPRLLAPTGVVDGVGRGTAGAVNPHAESVG